MKALFYLSIISLIFGCTKPTKQHYTFKQFPAEERVQLQNIDVPPVLYRAVDMVLLNDGLVVLSLMSEKHLQLFDKDLNFKKQLIEKGEGVNAESVIIPAMVRGGGNIFFYKSFGKLQYLKLDSLMFDLIPLKAHYLPDEWIEVSYITQLKSNLIGYSPAMPIKKEFLRLDTTNNQFVEFGPDFPDLGKELNLIQRQSIFGKLISKKPDDSKFAAMYERFPILRIYDSSGKLLEEVRYDNYQQNPVQILLKNNTGNQDLTLNYFKMRATQNYIYGLYSGKTMRELETFRNQIDDWCYELHVYDWEGNPVKRMFFDRPFFSFDVSADDHMVVLGSVNEFDKLFTFELNLKTNPQ